MNNKTTYNIIATFFVNELLTTILPTSRKDLLERYRDNLDDYFNTLSMFSTGRNPAYDVVEGKIVAFHNKYVSIDKNTLIERISGELCSPASFSRLSFVDKAGLFKKFILNCCKTFIAICLSNSAIYIKFCEKDSLTEKEKLELKKFKQSTVQKFEKIIDNNKNQLYSQFMCLERGEDPQTIDVINKESKLLEELRKQNEELRFTILKLKDELSRVKIKNAEPETNKFQEINKFQEDDDKYEWD